MFRLLATSLTVLALVPAFIQTACADVLPCKADRGVTITMREARLLYEQGQFAESAAAFARIARDAGDAPPRRLEAFAGLERALKAQACDQEAIAVIRERLALAERIGDEQARRQSWARLARLSLTRDSGEATQLAHRVLDTARRSQESDDDASDAYTTLAIITLGNDDLLTAQGLLTSALATATTSLRRAEAWRTLGVLRVGDAKYGSALEACHNSLTSANEAADVEAKALAQICVAGALPSAQAQEASNLWADARAQAQASHMRRVEAFVDFEEGKRLRTTPQYTARVRAQQLLSQAARLYGNIGDRSQERAAQLELATTSYALGDDETATAAVERSGVLSRSLGYTVEAAKADHLQGLIAMNQTPVDRRAVLVKLQLALAGMQRSEGRSQQARVLHDMAVVALSDGDTASAQRWLLQAQSLLTDSREADALPMRQQVNVALGWTLLEQGSTDTAIALLRTVTEPDSGETSGQAWWGLARAYTTYGQFEVARLYYERALCDIDPLRPRGRDLPGTASLAFDRNYSSLYREFAALLLQLKQPAQAHYVTHLMQRMELLEADWPPVRGEGAESSLPVVQSMAQAGCEKDLAAREAQYTQLWSQTRSDPARQPPGCCPYSPGASTCQGPLESVRAYCELDSQVQTLQKVLKRDEKDCVDSLKTASRDTAFAAEPRFRDNWEKAFGTDAGVTLVVTIVENDRLDVIVRSSATAGYVVRSRPVGLAGIKELVAQWQIALQNEANMRHELRGEQLKADEARRAEQLRNGVLRQLYDLLFGGLESAMLPPRKDGKRAYLAVALDGPLRKVPMAALYDGQHYLGEKAAIALLTPTTLVTREFGENQPEPGLVLGMSRSARPALPNVEVEVKKVASTLHVEPHLDEGASPKLLLAWLKALDSQALALHVAAHGAIGESPSTAVIHLWGGDINGRQIGEMTDQFAHLRLVVLSACESAGVGSGDLALGLAGLAELGARSVIGSLWEVDDQATTELMEAFYLNWMAQHAKGVSQALAAAQQQVREDHPHPFYWAAFVTIGRWD
ncbi:hypothetical protein WJ69_21835 [Burkholderia ubonensis]|nr:hypothetical protein WJ69_21835 [Burkholderia ubonensis]